MAMLKDGTRPLEQLEVIDDLQRLGLGYHFEQEIKSALRKVYEDRSFEALERKDLHAAALRFRLLRQHGYEISQGLIYFHIFLCLFALRMCLICVFVRVRVMCRCF